MKLFSKECLVGEFLVAEVHTTSGPRLHTTPNFDNFEDAERYLKEQIKSPKAYVVQVVGEYLSTSSYVEVHPGKP